MWEKNGKPFSGTSVIIGDRRVFNPTPEQFRAAGYEWKEPPAPEPLPKKYSRLKIVRKLGDQWPAIKAQIEAAGLLEEFRYADYLDEADEHFASFLKDLPQELKDQLEDCLWED